MLTEQSKRIIALIRNSQKINKQNLPKQNLPEKQIQRKAIRKTKWSGSSNISTKSQIITRHQLFDIIKTHCEPSTLCVINNQNKIGWLKRNHQDFDRAIEAWKNNTLGKESFE